MNSVSTFTRLWEAIKQYSTSQTALEKDRVWSDIMDLARQGEAGIQKKTESSFLHYCYLTNNAFDFPEERLCEFYEALSDDKKQEVIAFRQSDMVMSPTLLMLVAQHNQSKLLSQLLLHGANPNDGDADGDGALVYACLGNAHECMDILFSHGADPNLFNEELDSPLMYCCSNVKNISDITIAKLLDNGALPYLKNSFGVSAWDLAQRYPACLAVFSHHEAKEIDSLTKRVDLTHPRVRI